MKRLFLATVLAVLAPAAAFAATLSFPSDAPVASITIPDDWSPKETETGVDATSPDNVVYLSVDVADSASPDKVIGDAVDWLEKENKVVVDTATMKESDWTLNGMNAKTMLYDGTDESGPSTIGMILVAPSPKNLLVITYWGSKDGEDALSEKLGGIMQSLKPAK